MCMCQLPFFFSVSMVWRLQRWVHWSLCYITGAPPGSYNPPPNVYPPPIFIPPQYLYPPNIYTPLGLLGVLPKSVPPSALHKETQHEQIQSTISTPLQWSLTEGGDCGLLLDIRNTAGGMGHSSRRCCPSSISTSYTHIHDMLIWIKLVLSCTLPPKYLYPPGLIGRSAEIYTPGYTFWGGGGHCFLLMTPLSSRPGTATPSD